MAKMRIAAKRKIWSREIMATSTKLPPDLPPHNREDFCGASGWPKSAAIDGLWPFRGGRGSVTRPAHSTSRRARGAHVTERGH